MNRKEQLLNACQNGDIKTVKSLLRQRTNPNARTSNKLTPLILAAQNGHTPIIALLVQHGAAPHLTDNDQHTALHHAVENLRHEAAEYLITQLQLDPNAPNRLGVTPIMLAAKNGDLPMIELLLHHGANPCATTSFKWSAIHYAINSEHYPIAHYLHRNFHPPIDSEWLSIRLISAATKGSIHALQCLTDLGANPHIIDYTGRTLLHHAVENLHHEAAEYLITELKLDLNVKDKMRITPFMIAAQKGDIKMLRLLAQHGANPHATDFQNQNALHYATENNKIRAIRYLITKLNFDPNAQDRWGYTPFILATKNGYIKAMRQLVKLGANPYITDFNRQTALFHAVKNRRHYLIPYLIFRFDFDPNHEDRHKQTPIFVAAEGDDISIFNLLIACGANPYHTDEYGRSALHHCAYQGSTDAAAYLISHLQLDPNQQDYRGNTPLLMAICRERVNMVHTLLKLGANFHVKNHKRESAFTIAKQFNMNLIPLSSSISSIRL